MSTPPGWYADPTPPPGHAPALRYWDGTTWTDHLAAAPAAGPLPPTTPDGEELAGWGRRLAAYVLDSLVTTVVAVVLGWPFLVAIVDYYLELLAEVGRTAGTGQEPPQPGPFVLYTDLLGPFLGWAAVSWLVLTCYQLGFLRWRGATPGKLVLGLRVRLRERPGRLPWSTLGRRWAVLLLPALLAGLPLVGVVASLYLLLDGLWPLWDARRQALHDKVAGTNVVRVRRPAAAQPKMPG